MANNNANVTVANGVNNANQTIVDSWSLLAFAAAKGSMQLGSFVNKETGEEFKSCIFTNPQNQERTFVAFSSKLGELTAQQISALKNDLQVIENNTGHFILCKAGSNSWEDVQL